MYNRSQNPQVQYSLLQLTQSLFYHLQHNPLHKITVTEICQRAGLTRRTFYRNCERKEDLILFACDWLVKQLVSGMDDSSSDARSMYRYFFGYWYDHHIFLRCIYQCGLFELFADRFLAICNNGIRYPLQDQFLEQRQNPETLRRFHNAFLLGGLTRMLYIWTEEDFCTPAEELINSILFLLPQEYQDGLSQTSAQCT